MKGWLAFDTSLTRLVPWYGCALLMVFMGMQARALPAVAAEHGAMARVSGGGALAALDDAELAGVTGEGIAIVAEDFRFQMKNTGYVEQIGSAPPSGSGFQRGDLRWYGLTLSGAGAADGLGWTGESCGHALCPLANTGFLMAPFDNPYLLRVFDKTGYDFQNNSVTRVVLEVVGPTNSDPYRWAFWGEAEVGKSGTTNSGLLQSQVLIAGKPVSPHATITRSTSTTTTQDVSDAVGTTYVYTPTTTTKNVVNSVSCGFLCTRKDRTSTTETYSTTTTGAGTLFRVFQNQDNNDRTLALNWHSRLSGDFRFSLAQTSGSAGALGSVPLFDNGTSVGNAPGLKFRNVNAYFPLGQLFYQSLILDDTQAGATAGNGNFVIELTRLPNQANAYNDFYSISTSALGCEDPRYSGNNCGYQRNGRPDRYRETHGYVRWGDWYPGNGANCGAAGTLCNTFDSTADGIIFSKATAAGTFTAVASRPDADAPIDNDPPVPVITQSRAGLSSVNLGDSRIEGLLIQHLKITTLGAGP